MILILAAAACAAQQPPGPCGAIKTFEDGLAPARIVHVSVSGDDDGDGSERRPFSTIARAARGITGGTAIRVHAGTYPMSAGGSLPALAGSAAAPIWIGGAPGERRPVLDGGGQALHLVRPRYVVVHDLEIRNAAHNGINADDGGDYANGEAARFLVFRNLDVHDVGGSGNQDGLKLSGVNDYWVLDSRFARCGGGQSGSGIDQVGCRRGLIARCVFEQMSGNAVQAKGGSDDVEIRACRIVDGGARAVNAGGSTGFEYFRPPLSTTQTNFEARNVRVVANVIVGGETAVAFTGCVDCLAAHNTIVDPGRWVLRILQETTTRDGHAFAPAARGRFVNNLVSFERRGLGSIANVGPGTDAASFRFESNLWYAHDDPGRSKPAGLPAAETGAVVGRDPKVGDARAGAPRIPKASPAAGAGTRVAEVPGDFAGRCFGTPPSIGAFEAER